MLKIDCYGNVTIDIPGIKSTPHLIFLDARSKIKHVDLMLVRLVFTHLTSDAIYVFFNPLSIYVISDIVPVTHILLWWDKLMPVESQPMPRVLSFDQDYWFLFSW